MHEVNESETAPYPPKKMFELVADVDKYQEFLPWCEETRVVRREDNMVVAEFRAKLGPTGISFTTRNEFHPYESIDIHLLEGPFEVFEGRWRFSAASESSSKAEFHLRFKFAHEHLGFLFDPIFREATEAMVRDFKKRAEAIYG